MKLHYGLLNALNHVFENVPEATPHRFDHILSMIQPIMVFFDADLPAKDYVVIDVHDGFAQTPFVPTLEVIGRLSNYLPMGKIDTNVEKALVLVPSQLICCKKSIRMDNRSAGLVLYTENGVVSVKNFHGKCVKCGAAYYHGYFEDKSKTRRSFVTEESEYVMVTSTTGFSKKLLDDITYQIFIGVVSFEAAAGTRAFTLITFRVSNKGIFYS